MTIRRLIDNELAETVFFVAVFLILLLSSCATDSGQRAETLIRQLPTESQSVSAGGKLNERLLEAQRPIVPGDYRIGPEDLLEITVFRAPELNTVARVNASGLIRLSLIDNVHAAGLSVAELEKELAERLTKFLAEPVVSVFVKEYRSQQITVLGSVKTPGVYFVTGQRYLLDLLSMAGGLSAEAGDVCIIHRASGPSPDASTSETVVVDLSQLLVKGHAEFNIPLHAGDRIHVPQSGIFFVDGAIRSPGSFPLKGTITLTQAISMAKGFGYEAEHDSIKIYRETGKPEREVITVNYDAVLKRTAPDVEIRDKDVIIVSTSAFKNFLKGVAGTINFGVFSLGKYSGL
ncbi:MAG: polysaccharide export protein [Nitrospiraceae bacterium]|nr:polysaccharide export protein [Nitrospiraceae bacterium]